jgi:GalNAc5-diNAcBac-PP-undecaprenol beta-1,3-glucosyltransferase
MPTFTVVIPTFNNCQTLRYSIESVLNQTVSDFELFVVGDGCPAASKEIVNDFCQRDPRVVFFDNPKGPRHGELHRHAALQQARGRYVTYLSDDDLFLSNHLSVVLKAFEQGAEFVHTLLIHVIPPSLPSEERFIELPELPGKRLFLYRGLIDRPESLRELTEGHNFLSLSSVSHTLELYQKLPYGWRTTPQGIYTDLYMWQQFASLPGWKGAAIPQATLIHCAKSLRNEWSDEERLSELADWSLLMQREDLRMILERAALALSLSTLVSDDERMRGLLRQLEDAQEQRHRIQEQANDLQEQSKDLQKQSNELRECIASLRVALTEKEADLTEAVSTLQRIYQSRTMRAIERLRRYPFLHRIGAAIARLLSR